MPFDKSKPYQSFGMPSKYKYIQDGKYYDANFKEITQDGEETKEEKPKRRGRPRKKE